MVLGGARHGKRKPAADDRRPLPFLLACRRAEYPQSMPRESTGLRQQGDLGSLKERRYEGNIKGKGGHLRPAIHHCVELRERDQQQKKEREIERKLLKQEWGGGPQMQGYLIPLERPWLYNTTTRRKRERKSPTKAIGQGRGSRVKQATGERERAKKKWKGQVQY